MASISTERIGMRTLICALTTFLAAFACLYGDNRLVVYAVWEISSLRGKLFFPTLVAAAVMVSLYLISGNRGVSLTALLGSLGASLAIAVLGDVRALVFLWLYLISILIVLGICGIKKLWVF